MEASVVHIETLDGSGFEALCAEVFRRLGYEVENVKDTGDEGRDLVLRGRDGRLIVAECKHWPQGSVGRPVVQKLHSAIVSLPAHQGMLLTTGSFTKQAKEYADKLDITIELIDKARLKDLAAKVGIQLLTATDPVPVRVFLISGADRLRSVLVSSVGARLVSSPSRPEDVWFWKPVAVELVPTFFIRYSVRQEFATSVGVVHRLDVSDGNVLVNGSDGSIMDNQLAMFMRPAVPSPLAQAMGSFSSAKRGAYTLLLAEATEVAKEAIRAVHTTVVTYSGRNNRTYSLECVPSKKNIWLKEIRQIYIPYQQAEVTSVRHTYQLRFVENGNEFYWIQFPRLLECLVCGKPYNHGLLCNACGSIAHSPRFLAPHSFRCVACKKTICKECAYWERRWLVLKKILCAVCASKPGENPPRKLLRSRS